MTIDWSLLIGLLSIALALFFGLFFGLRGLRMEVGGQLREIKDKVLEISKTVEKIWDLAVETLPRLASQRRETIERNIKNLGRTTISARPKKDGTDYVIEVEKPLLQEGLIGKLSKESGLESQEKQLFGAEKSFHLLGPTRMIMHIPCIDPKLCTEYVTLFLKWLDSTYFEAFGKIKEFEEPILKD